MNAAKLSYKGLDLVAVKGAEKAQTADRKNCGTLCYYFKEGRLEVTPGSKRAKWVKQGFEWMLYRANGDKEALYKPVSKGCPIDYVSLVEVSA